MSYKGNGLLLIICLLFLIVQGSRAQTRTISVDVKNASLEQVLSLIEKQSDYKISYRNSILDRSPDITLKRENVAVEELLQTILTPKGLKYNIAAGNSIVITRDDASLRQSAPVGRRITGLVTDDKGVPAIGANISVKGSTTGTVTDIDGKFELEAPSNASLVVSYIGYYTETLEIRDRSHIAVRLREDTRLLDEVVVVGYGTQKKVNLTGSVAMITADELNSRPVSSVSSGLQGLLSGVTVVNATGQPGANSTSIRIRGLGTIGNANPLILVDGVEGDMNNLNPEDI